VAVLKNETEYDWATEEGAIPIGKVRLFYVKGYPEGFIFAIVSCRGL